MSAADQESALDSIFKVSGRQSCWDRLEYAFVSSLRTRDRFVSILCRFAGQLQLALFVLLLNSFVVTSEFVGFTIRRRMMNHPGDHDRIPCCSYHCCRANKHIELPFASPTQTILTEFLIVSPDNDALYVLVLFKIHPSSTGWPLLDGLASEKTFALRVHFMQPDHHADGDLRRPMPLSLWDCHIGMEGSCAVVC
jgi:hypothetical protein